MSRHPPPIGSNESPYSLAVQLFIDESVTSGLGTSWNVAVPHLSEDECCMPKLCPGSWISTTQPTEWLYQVFRCGEVGVPTDARPLQLHEPVLVPKIQR